MSSGVSWTLAAPTFSARWTRLPVPGMGSITGAAASSACPPPPLPAFWRAISPALPDGAGVQTLRHIVYFGSYDITGNLIIIAAYIVTAITGPRSSPVAPPRANRQRQFSDWAPGGEDGSPRRSHQD